MKKTLFPGGPVSAGALFIVLLTLAGCDLVVFSADAVRGVRVAEDMRELGSITVDFWDEFDDDSDEDFIAMPVAFFPDSRTDVTGYLVADLGFEIMVFRVERGGLGFERGETTDEERFRVPKRADRGPGFIWSVHHVPATTASVEPPPLLVATSFDDRWGLRLHWVFSRRGSSDNLDTYQLDVERLLDEGGVTMGDPRVLGVQVVPIVGQETGVEAELQLLVRDANMLDTNLPGPLREFFIGLNGRDIKEGLGRGGVPETRYFRQGNVTFPRPRMSDDTPVNAVHYGSARLSDDDPTDRRGYLTYADGLYRGAPLRTLVWEDAAPQEIEFWRRPIRTMTMEGLLRDTSRGTITRLNARADEGAQLSSRNYGTLTYSGRYRAGVEDEQVFTDIYVAIGRSYSAVGWKIALTIYEDAQ
ncbi:MAG: hypothetical protein EA427_05365 [Spirochaetaceae bacterium]|nr:MAG: hypothetical protein EA427_05365 [Spirochaetaceae bacterium]